MHYLALNPGEDYLHLALFLCTQPRSRSNFLWSFQCVFDTPPFHLSVFFHCCHRPLISAYKSLGLDLWKG